MEKKMNIVSSYFYYMWNAWSKKECEIVFAHSDWNHFWNKWIAACNRGGTSGAAERLWAELSDTYREPLIKRACELYDGRYEKY